MPTYKIRLADNTIEPVEGRKFAFYVQNVREWFFVHRSVTGWTVSHLDSGMRVCAVEHLTLNACLNDEVSAAKLSLTKLCERAGHARVRSVLAGAPALKAA
jgi:hypothetical protein